MKNSTLNNLPSLVPSEIKNLFCILDEYGALGFEPKTHPGWEEFIHALQAKYSELIAGIMIFSYLENGQISFCFMLFPIGPINRGDSLTLEKMFGELIEVFKIHEGRKFVEFVRI